MTKQFPILVGFTAYLLAGTPFGQTIQVRQDPVVIDLTAQDLIGSPGAVQSVDVGSESLLVTGSVVTATLSAGSVPINDTVTRFFNAEIFRISFRNQAVPCAGSFSITGSVEDDLGNPGRVSSVINPASFVFMTFTPTEINRRCRGNGSLLRVSYGGDFEISGIANSSASGAYTGTLTINIAYP